LTLGASSVWLFHYARSGLRAITSPFFLVVFWLLLDRAERAKESRWIALAAGAMLGLSLYSYTSCRVLPIIFLLYAGLRVLQDRQNRSGLLGCYGYTLAGAFIFSIPNLIFLVRFPQEFLFRGSYSIPQEAGLKITGLVWSFLFPFFYPSHLTSEFYQRVFEVDSVSNGLVVAGISPIHIIVAFAFLTGLARACRDWRESGAAFLLISWSAGTIILGIAGPSLTRLLILLPVYLLLAALGFAEGLKRLPGYRWVFVALLALVVVSHGYRYFYEVGSSPHAKFYASAVATPMGERAAVLAAAGRRVVCVVFKDANVIRYLTRSHGSNVQVAEFYFRPLVLREIPLEEFKPEILLIERTPEFVRLSAIFRQNLVATNELFDEIHLPVSR
jgi:hypothetical protein